MKISPSTEHGDSIEKLPTDIYDIIEKKVKYLSIHDFKMLAIDKADLPQTSMLLDFRNCGDGDNFEAWESSVKSLREKYIYQLINLWLDTNTHSVWIYFKSEYGDAIVFELPSSSFDNCKYTFNVSYFLPYYVAHYDVWVKENEAWEKTNIPQNSTQKRIWDIFNDFFKWHWYSKLDENIMNIELPIIGNNNHGWGWDGEYPYRVYELLFWE